VINFNPFAKKTVIYLLKDKNRIAAYKIGWTDNKLEKRREAVDKATDGNQDGNVKIIFSIRICHAYQEEQRLLRGTKRLQIKARGSGRTEWRRLPLFSHLLVVLWMIVLVVLDIGLEIILLITSLLMYKYGL